MLTSILRQSSASFRRFVWHGLIRPNLTMGVRVAASHHSADLSHGFNPHPAFARGVHLSEHLKGRATLHLVALAQRSAVVEGVA